MNRDAKEIERLAAVAGANRNHPALDALVNYALVPSYEGFRAVATEIVALIDRARPSGHEDDPGACARCGETLVVKSEEPFLLVCAKCGRRWPPTVDALSKARSEGRREGIEEAARAIREWSSDTRDRRDLLEVVDALVSGGANKADDPEARLRRFAERYSVSNLDCRFMAGSDVDPREPWRMTWCRNYEDATSDVRAVDGRDLSDVVRQAEEWESENDRREPQHAGGANKGSKEGGR